MKLRLFASSCVVAMLAAGVVPMASAAAAAAPNAAQWTKVPDPPDVQQRSAFLDAVACRGASSCIAVGTMEGLTEVPLVDVWDGAHWTQQPTPDLGAGKYGALRGVACATVSTCFAVGSTSLSRQNNSPLVERWNGTSWSVVPMPVPGDATQGAQFSSVSCGGATSCTAVGSYATDNAAGRIIEHWNGTSWALQSSPSPSPVHFSYFDAVSCGSPTTCTAVGLTEGTGSSQGEVIEQWNGAQWSITSALKYPGWGLSAVSCFDSWHCLATGAAGALRGAGTTWTNVSPPKNQQPGDFRAVKCTAPVDCTTLVDESPTAMHWNGSSWQLETFPAADKNVLTVALACAKTGSCLAVGALAQTPHAEILHGTTWSSLPVPGPIGTTPGYVDGVSCDTASHCVAVGTVFGASEFTQYIEDWNGAAWSTDRRPIQAPRYTQLYGVSCTSSQSCVAVGEQLALNQEAKVGVALVLQGGRWVPYKIDNTWLLTGVSCTSSSHCVAVGYAGGNAIAVQWDGSRWSTPVTVIPDPDGRSAGYLTSVACAAATDCTAAGWFGKTGATVVPVVARLQAGVWHTQQLTVPSAHGARLTGVACSTATQCVAVGQAETPDYRHITPLVAESNGNTWQVGFAPVAPGQTSTVLTGVACIGATAQCWATGFSGPQGDSPVRAALEHWDGAHWSYVAGPPPAAGDGGNELDGVACVASGQCMAVGQDTPACAGYAAGSPLAVVYR